MLHFRALPLENNSNTVIVVGGVHWIAKKHIDIILEALKRYTDMQFSRHFHLNIFINLELPVTMEYFKISSLKHDFNV